MARRRRHRRATAPVSAFAVISKKVAAAFKAYKHFLFVDFPSLGILNKDYEKAYQKKSKDKQEKSYENRFAGYQRLCLFGLGSMFWSSATGVLASIEDKEKSKWVNYCFIYSAVALVFMLIGLLASTFPDSSWLAPSTSGLGALHGLIFVLGTFHVGSLKYHSYLDECLNSMTGCTVAVTIYWGLSVQDPLPLHIVSKVVVWVIGIVVYGVLFLLYGLYLLMNWLVSGIGGIFSTSWEYLWTSENSLKNRLGIKDYLNMSPTEYILRCFSGRIPSQCEVTAAFSVDIIVGLLSPILLCIIH